MAVKIKSMRELDMIKGKMLVATATQEELQDFYGTEGWQHCLGIDE